MPLWTFSLRSLAFRCSIRPSNRISKRRQQWQLPLPLWRSYGTALPESRRDDATFTSHTLTYEHSDRLGHISSVSAVETPRPTKREPDEASRKKPAQTSRHAIRRFRGSRYTISMKRRSITTRPSPYKTLSRSGRRLLGIWRAKKVSNSVTVFARRRRRRMKISTPLEYTLRKLYSSWTTSRWKRQFSQISVQPDKRFQQTHPQLRGIPILDPRAFEWTSFILQRMEAGQQSFSQADLLFDDLLFYEEEDHEFVWTQIALWLLTYDQEQMMRFLLATHSELDLPATYIEDSLRQLALHWSSSDFSEGLTQMPQLAELFCVLANRTGTTPLAMFGPFARKLMPYCSDELVHRMYQAIKDHKVQMIGLSYLHFATYFANQGRFQQALEALSAAKSAGANVNGFGFRSNCSTLLRKSIEETGGLRECLRVVSTIVDMGVRLNNQICDIIMLNAVEAGDLKTAFSVYHSLMERGLRPTQSTFMVLLKGCKMNIEDAETLNEVIRSAISNVSVRNSPLVATEILHCLTLHHSKLHPEMALTTLTAAYAELFDIRPLQKLGLPLPKLTQQRSVDEQIMSPTRHAMSMLLSASVLPAHSHPPSSSEILKIYESWRKQVELGDPILASLATTDHVANIFLMAFIKKSTSLLHAARVVRDMQRPLPASAGVEQCKPTVQTWSIFLHGFTRHGKTKLAEQVLNYMRSKGLQPDQPMWNTLVTGYAREQDEEGMIDALRRAEQSGMIWNSWTHGGVKKLRNQERLQEELKKGRLQRSLDFTNDLKHGLDERFKDSATEAQKEGAVVTPSVTDEPLTAPEPDVNVDGFGDSPAELAEQTHSRPC